MTIVVKVIGTPIYKGREGDAGYDLKAKNGGSLAPGERQLVLTGTSLRMSSNAVGYICSRSGLALNHGVSVLNAPGVIDPNYEGELGVILHNSDPKEYFGWEAGARIAQIVFHELAPLTHLVHEYGDNGGPFVIVENEEVRGKHGFGSSGGY